MHHSEKSIVSGQPTPTGVARVVLRGGVCGCGACMSAGATRATLRKVNHRPAAGTLAVSVGAGLFWGIVSSLANIARWSWLRALSQITGQRWSWCVVAFFIGFALRRVSMAMEKSPLVAK